MFEGKKFKRIRQESHESTGEPDTPVQPRKRIRMISSDSGEDSNSQSTIDLDSQGTIGYSMESQRSDATVVYDVDEINDSTPLTADQKKKIDFLRDCFVDKTDQV